MLYFAFLSVFSCLIIVMAAPSPDLCRSDDLKCQLPTSERQSGAPPDDLFGRPRSISPVEDDLGQLHPRVLFNKEEFEKAVSLYSERAVVPGSFPRRMMAITKNLYLTAKLETLRSKLLSDEELQNLGPNYSGEQEAQGFYAVSFTAFVYRKQAKKHQLECSGDGEKKICCPDGENSSVYCMSDVSEAADYMKKTKVMLKNWVRYLTLRRQSTPLQSFGVQQSRSMGGAGFILAYDIMYNEFTRDEQEPFDSWFGSVVKDLYQSYWGYGLPKTRIFSNWAAYNSDIYLISCLLEQTTEHKDERAILDREYGKILIGFAENSIYESGFTFEDGYTLSIGFREGSTGFVALARRGYNVFETKRFRNLISYAAQSYEPWQCSQFIGHSSGSGGGYMYQTFLAVQRYAYPDGALSNHLWRKTLGENYNCYFKMQTGLGLLLFGGDHIDNSPANPEDVVGTSGSKMALHAYGRERGLLIARSSLSPEALYVHFNGRHDAMFPGHDNADRATFTLSSHGRTWVPELPWRQNYQANRHCMVMIDGIGQYDQKVPSAKMIHDPLEESGVLISTVDLTYATSYKWNRPWAGKGRNSEGGSEWEHEVSDPRTLGFPSDVADKMSLPNTLFGHADWGFAGFYQYRALYNPVKYNTRTTALVRDHEGASYFVVGDRVEKTDSDEHEFSWEMTLAADVADSVIQDQSTGAIILSTTAGAPEKKLAVYAVISIGGETTVPSQESFEIRSIADDKAKRLYIKPKSKAAGQVRFTVVLYPFLEGADALLKVSGEEGGDVSVKFKSEMKRFSVASDGDGRFSITDPAEATAPAPTQPAPVSEWTALPNAGDVPLPPQHIGYLPPGWQKVSPQNPQPYSSPTSRVFDRRLELNEQDRLENEYEHLIIILAPGDGKYGFRVCEGLPKDDDPNLSVYRFLDKKIFGGRLYAAYQMRQLERMNGDSERCQFEATLVKGRVYLLAASSPYTKIDLSYGMLEEN